MIIYKATSKTNSKIYIGKTTKTLQKRKKTHFYYAKDKSRHYYFVNALRKYGLEGFIWEEIDIADSIDELNYLEKYWIRFYRADNKKYGYNSTKGGDGAALNMEARNKMSNTIKQKYLSGYVNPTKGKKYPDEFAAHRRKPIICEETSIKYQSLTHAARELLEKKICKSLISGITSISSAIRGTSITAFNYHWKYINKDKII